MDVNLLLKIAIQERALDVHVMDWPPTVRGES
jgi:hypothetical protein